MIKSYFCIRIVIYATNLLKGKDMATARIEYLGNLRTKYTHLKSGTEIISDAPTDNKGKGETFSPTDLVASSYAGCMITIIGIHCQENDITFNRAVAEVDKIMESNPRRIGGINIIMDLSGNDWDKDIQERIIRVGEACPVAKSVHEGIVINFTYRF